jgi:membrane protein
MPLVTSFRILVRAGQQWSANQDSRLGAALAYYALFSIAPLLVIAIHIAGVFFGEDAARGQVVSYLSTFIDADSARFVQSLVENAADNAQSGVWASLVSVGVLLIGALSVFLQVRGALCGIWRLQPPHGNTILAMLIDYALALVMVMVTSILLLLSLAISVIMPLLQEWMKSQLPDKSFPWRYGDVATAVLCLTLLFTAIFRILSGQRIEWKYALYGAIITALLFSIGTFALGLYLAYTHTVSAYGAAGSLVVFLIWVYYSAQILFFGAELIQARRTRHEWMGKR